VADTLNLDDLLPNSSALDLDDTEMGDQNLVDNLISLANGTWNMAHSASSIDKDTTQKPDKDIVVIVDIDSLALAASESFEKETILASNNSNINTEEHRKSSSEKVESGQHLYIQFKSLII